MFGARQLNCTQVLLSDHGSKKSLNRQMLVGYCSCAAGTLSSKTKPTGWGGLKFANYIAGGPVKSASDGWSAQMTRPTAQALCNSARSSRALMRRAAQLRCPGKASPADVPAFDLALSTRGSKLNFGA